MAERSAPIIAFRKEAPPPRVRFGRVSLAERCSDVLEKVAAEPGEWFAILDYGERVQSAISGVTALKRNAHGYEFTARNGVVYARFVGTEVKR